MKKINFWFGAFIFLISLSAIVSAQDYQGCSMMQGLYGNYGTGFMFLGWITFILFIALVIAGIYWLIKSANRKK